MLEVDLSKALPAQLAAYPAVVEAVIPEIAKETRKELVNRARQRLGHSRDAYIEGLQPARHMRGSTLPTGNVIAQIVLIGMVPNLIERGWSGGDMKADLLRGRSVKTSKAGMPYARVPIHGGRGRPIAPGTENPMSGLRARQTGEKAARAHRQGGKPSVTSGGAMERAMARKRRKSKPDAIVTVTRQSSGFVHPGIEPVGLFEDAAEFTGRIATQLLEHAMQGAEKGSIT